MPTRTITVPPVEVATVSVEREQTLDRWHTPWRLRAPGIAEAWFESPEHVYEEFFGEDSRFRLEATSMDLLRECLAELGVSHGTDPRVRTKAELAALPPGATLTYYGMGESFHAVKQRNGKWVSEAGVVDPTTLRTWGS
jgi:hypothetical protein